MEWIIVGLFVAFIIFLAVTFLHPAFDPVSACVDEETGEMICSYYDS